MWKYFRNYIEKLLLKEGSCKKLAISFSAGTFIAIAPVIPFQTPLLFLVSWLFRLNASIVFAAVYVINNPITLIPIYVMDYAFGSWFFQTFLGINLLQFNPSWMEKANSFISKYVDIKKYLGEDLCLWCLILGGVMVAAFFSVIMYPIMLRICERLSLELKKYEAHNTK